MKQKQHSTEEIIRILRQAETDAAIDSVCREHNVSKATVVSTLKCTMMFQDLSG